MFIILTESYVGSSDFIFDMRCSGRKLEKSELRERGLVTPGLKRQFLESSYISEWYEVTLGDYVNIACRDDEMDIDELFMIPENLENPPLRLEDQWGYKRFLTYFRTHCICCE